MAVSSRRFRGLRCWFVVKRTRKCWNLVCLFFPWTSYSWLQTNRWRRTGHLKKTNILVVFVETDSASLLCSRRSNSIPRSIFFFFFFFAEKDWATVADGRFKTTSSNLNLFIKTFSTLWKLWLCYIHLSARLVALTFQCCKLSTELLPHPKYPLVYVPTHSIQVASNGIKHQK